MNLLSWSGIQKRQSMISSNTLKRRYNNIWLGLPRSLWPTFSWDLDKNWHLTILTSAACLYQLRCSIAEPNIAWIRLLVRAPCHPQSKSPCRMIMTGFYILSKTDAMDKWKPDHNAQSVDPLFHHLWLFSLVVLVITLDILFWFWLVLIYFYIKNSDTH